MKRTSAGAAGRAIGSVWRSSCGAAAVSSITQTHPPPDPKPRRRDRMARIFLPRRKGFDWHRIATERDYAPPLGGERRSAAPTLWCSWFSRPYESLIGLRAAYMPDAARAVSCHPPSFSRETGQPPVLTSPNPISTLHRRFACARLYNLAGLDFLSRRDCNAHHHGF
jgi:hypothetical protein